MYLWGPNEPSDYNRPEQSLGYTNLLTTAPLPTATLSVYNNASGKGMGLVSDYYKYPTQNKYRINVAQISQSKGATAVRCMSDPNSKYLGNFETEFIAAAGIADKTDDPDTLKQWTRDANSYIVMTGTDTVKRINLRKAYAMHKLFTSENNQLPQGSPSVSVYWSTNASLVNSVSMVGSEIGASEMVVSLKPAQTGNAVVAYHMGATGTAADPVIWSWHIWAPETAPAGITPYKTEEVYPSSSGQIINPTNNCIFPVLETTFMDRNMGALIAFPATGGLDLATGRKAIGLHYQWGRKDPIPTDQTPVFRGGASLTASQYNNSYTKLFSAYGAAIGGSSDKKHVKIAKVLKYSVENPLAYLYNNGGSKDWISNEEGQAPERWGHATEKSPFDPCPDGWRVPDVSFPIIATPFQQALASIGVKGTSPWYKGRGADPKNAGLLGIDQIWTDNSSAPQAYMGYFTSYGVSVPGWTSTWAGWIFNHPDYNVGNYPVTGIRGDLNNAVAVNFPRVALWTAAMAEPLRDPGSFAIALSIRQSRMQTGAGYSPHAGMSCRCAKINYDDNGKEIGRYDPGALPVSQGAAQRPADVFEPEKIAGMLREKSIGVFPNPVTGIVRINAADDKEYYYQVYNMAGQLVKEGKFVNKQADFSTLQAGAYLVRINDSESVVKIVKL